MCVPTSGVKGDARSNGYTVAVRPVHTSDFMTAEGYPLPPNVVQEMTGVVTQYPGINRLIVDYTDKPPATIEYM